MEDLGDVLLQSRLLSHPVEKTAWLEEATRLIARLHGSTFPVPPHLPVATRAFDARKFADELGFTFEHLHQGLLKLPAPEPSLLKSVEAYCSELAAIRPQVFCHRDYHTRNLLVHEGRLRLIDFQDARLGPPEYDLASLFFDAYVPITETERASLLALYQRVLTSFPLGAQIDWDGFETRLDRVAFQRVVKAAGSFASFFTRYGKRTHLPYLLPALEMAQALQTKLGDEVPALPLALWIRKASEEAHP
jgi:aminoglycoside/choline kinase family phosphotransferase